MKMLTSAVAGAPEWIAARRGKITASAAANIIGTALPSMPTYRTPLQEFVRLRSELSGGDPDLAYDDDEDISFADNSDEDQEDATLSEALEWGLETESLHLNLLERRTGWPLAKCEGVYQHDRLPWLTCTFDAIATREGKDGPVELKAPTRFALGTWRHASPLAYQVQNHVQMMVADLPWGATSALIPPGVVFYTVDFDSPTADFIESKLSEFWDQLQRDIPPDPNPDNEGDLQLLRSMLVSEPTSIEWGYDMVELRDFYLLAQKTKKESEALMTRTKLSLIEKMRLSDGAYAQLAVLPDGTGFTLKKPKPYYKQPQPGKDITPGARLLFTKRARQ